MEELRDKEAGAIGETGLATEGTTGFEPLTLPRVNLCHLRYFNDLKTAGAANIGRSLFVQPPG
jgi:hypothetical protein